MEVNLSIEVRVEKIWKTKKTKRVTRTQVFGIRIFLLRVNFVKVAKKMMAAKK